MILDKRVHTNQSLASQIDWFDLPKLSKWCISQPFPCPHPCFCPLAECPLPPLSPCPPARITDAYRSLSSVGELASAICPVCRPTTPVKTNLNRKATHIILIVCNCMHRDHDISWFSKWQPSCWTIVQTKRFMEFSQHRILRIEELSWKWNNWVKMIKVNKFRCRSIPIVP